MPISMGPSKILKIWQTTNFVMDFEKNGKKADIRKTILAEYFAHIL
jgi:hypothetical protein